MKVFLMCIFLLKGIAVLLVCVVILLFVSMKRCLLVSILTEVTVSVWRISEKLSLGSEANPKMGCALSKKLKP